jgi:hypothetical protein
VKASEVAMDKRSNVKTLVWFGWAMKSIELEDDLADLTFFKWLHCLLLKREFATVPVQAAVPDILHTTRPFSWTHEFLLVHAHFETVLIARLLLQWYWSLIYLLEAEPWLPSVRSTYAKKTRQELILPQDDLELSA